MCIEKEFGKEIGREYTSILTAPLVRNVFAHMDFVGDGWDSWDALGSWSPVSMQRPQSF